MNSMRQVFGGRGSLRAWVLSGCFGLWLPVMPSALAQDATGAQAIAAAEASLEGVYNNFLHFARLGRFDTAASYADALLKHADLTPIKLLEVADKDPKSVETLTILLGNPTIGPNAKEVLSLIQRGEYEMRQDRERIVANIQSLGGAPQAEFLAIQHLRESGEYAIPWMLQTLNDPAQSNLHPRVIRALPKIGKNALNPLLEALLHAGPAIQKAIVQAVGEIGYRQSIPYLLKLMASSESTPEVQQACTDALSKILGTRVNRTPASVADSFTDLADAYYREESSVRADSRWENANVWRWDANENYLERIEVPRPIFGSVMAMNASQHALDADAAHEGALTLWLASNIRREARLGANVESDDPAGSTTDDATRPAEFPRALYFTQTAGAHYAHQVLARAIADSDQAVALGAIAALRAIAGPGSLIGNDGGTTPLVQALRFPDMLVRSRAALALAESLPRSGFYGAEMVVPALADALNQNNVAMGVVLVDPNAERLKGHVDAFRENTLVVGDGDLRGALSRAAAEMKAVNAIVLAADMQVPKLADAVRSLRAEQAYVNTPIVILAGAADRSMVDELSQTYAHIAAVDSNSDSAALRGKLVEFLATSGSVMVDADLARNLALDAADALRGVAMDGRTPFDLARAEGALVSGLQRAGDDELRLACAEALALIPTGTAQSAIAVAALSSDNAASLRLGLFDALAESGRANGAGLGDSELNALINLTMTEKDLTLRAAASRALGAMNVKGGQASEIVRKLRG